MALLKMKKSSKVDESPQVQGLLTLEERLLILQRNRIDAERPPIRGRLREQVFRRDSKRCFLCSTRKGLTIHHIVPRAEGGTDDIDNLITLCAGCHDTAETMPDVRSRADLIRLRYTQPRGKQIIGLKDGPPESKQALGESWMGEGQTPKQRARRAREFIQEYQNLGRNDDHIAILSRHTNLANTEVVLMALFPGGKTWDEIYRDHDGAEGRV